MAQRKLFDKKSLRAIGRYPLYSQDGRGDDAVASIKIFNPYGGQTYYLTEYDGRDTFFGVTDDGSGGREYGYFSKRELEDARVNVWGSRLPLERDAYFRPTRVGKLYPRSSSLAGRGFENGREGGTGEMGNANG